MAKSSKGKFNLISGDFKQVLHTCNESPHNQLEFRSLESNSIKINSKMQNFMKENSYSEVIKAFVQKIHERNHEKSKNETKQFTQLASSTPFKKCELKSSFNISGIAHLEATRKIDAFSLNDSDFQSMDQDQYDEDNEDDDETKENNSSNFQEIIKCMQIDSATKVGKKLQSSEKFKKYASPYKGKKNNKLKLTKEKSVAYLKSENRSLASIITTDSIKEIEMYSSKSLSRETSRRLDLDILNESLDFAFTQPNKTQSFEASIKNLTQLSVSI